MMKEDSSDTIMATLQKACADKTLVRVERGALDPHSYDGYVMAVAAELILLAVISGDIRLNGYTVLRTQDITYVENPAPHAEFQMAALALRDETPQTPSAIALSSMKALLSSLAGLYPLVTINREGIDPDICYIGRLRIAGDAKLMLNEIDPDANWYDTPAEFRYDDITRVDFGTAYEEALHQVAASRKASKNKP